MDTTTSTPTPTTERLHWPLVLGLAAFALVRPLFSIVGLTDALGKPATPLALTAVISLVWVLAVGLSRVGRPVLTLVAAGLFYAVLVIILSGILSPVLGGRLEGPLAMPASILPLLLTNAVWGLVTGALAAFLQRLRDGGR